MGWAARAKQSQGNPTPRRQQMRFIHAGQVDEARRQQRQRGGSLDVAIRFSDRAYVMNERGTIRRIALPIATPGATA